MGGQIEVRLNNFGLLLPEGVANFFNYLNDAITGSKIDCKEGLTVFKAPSYIIHLWDGLSYDEKRQVAAIIKSLTGNEGMNVRISDDRKEMTIALAVKGFAGGEDYLIA